MKNVFPKTISGALDVDNYLTVKNLIWNPNTLSWQAATGGSSGSDVNVTNFPAVQPVSDNGSSLTVDSNQLPSTLTGLGNLKVSIEEGSFSSDINVSEIGGNPVNVGSGNSSTGTQRVILASDQSAIPSSQSGTWIVQPGNTANTTPWLLTISQGGNSATVTASNALKTDGSAVTQPVSGTITSNQGTSPWVSNITQIGSNVVDLGAGNAGSGTQRVVIASDQATLNISVTNTTLAVTQSGTWNITNISGTVSLPTGAATSDLQTTGNTSLSSIDTKTPALGQTTMSGSVPVALSSDQSAIPVTQSGTWTDGGAGKTLKSASFSVSATGTIISAVPTKRIKVYAVKLVVSAAISVSFRSGASTALEGAMSLAQNGGFIENVNPPAFLFGTVAGESLDLVISGTGTAAGRISYWDDDAA